MGVFVATANPAPGPYQTGVISPGVGIVELPEVESDSTGGAVALSPTPYRFELTALGTYEVELRIQSAATDTGPDTAGVYWYTDIGTAPGAGTFVEGTGGFYSSASPSPPAVSVRTGSFVVTALPAWVDAVATLGDSSLPADGVLTGPGEFGPSDLGTRLTITAPTVSRGSMVGRVRWPVPPPMG